jgi:putative transposase
MAGRQRMPMQTIVHSHNTQRRLRRFCQSNKLEPGMSRRGNCWDNAVAKSFFSNLKKERIKKMIYKNCQRAIDDISDYIGSFYNRTR